MSQSTTFHPSSQGILDNDKPSLILRTDHRDRAFPSAELRNQNENLTQSTSVSFQSPSTGKIATLEFSTPSPCSNVTEVDDKQASTRTGIKQSVYPCEPCDSMELRCDGVRPMCNVCDFEGRRCYYEGRGVDATC